MRSMKKIGNKLITYKKMITAIRKHSEGDEMELKINRENTEEAIRVKVVVFGRSFLDFRTSRLHIVLVVEFRKLLF